ncbi:predicted protein [Nematostella vectensis]|uniref:Ubiquitin carboxyl-terminal hydrolase MINDY n=1 Tax=Nematostella vectensis TaxID=45351 RepID=A7T4T7_NEMVE|nr:predicted protein [Nematostella vectensis]|eukprot:XP_001621126.1 hypothetical protein NEMVEDRAFT_v1g222336 [Nematostella vectensis]
MADEGIADGNVFDDLSCFVWGSDLNEDNFKRWSQGFVFSQDEPSALVQLEGAEQATDLLARTLCQMLQMVKADDNIALVLMKDHPPCLSGQESQEKSQKMPDSTEFSNYHKTICQQSLRNLTSKDLHSSLRSIKCRNIEETRSLITRNTNIFESHFGVLLFLYSIILTRGIDTIKQEMEDSNEPLVDPDFGHGSVEFMRSRLDPDSVGIILLPNFLDDFFPREQFVECVTSFLAPGCNQA